MGDVFKREFSLGQVDTGNPYKGGDLPDGGGTATQLVKNAPPVPDIAIGKGLSVPGNPPASTTITRPTVLSAFLQNLGPAITGAMQAPRGSGFAGGIGGGFAGIEAEAGKKRQERVQQQQLDMQQRSLELRTQQEADMQRLHDEQFKNYQSLIETRANPPAKNQTEQFMRDYSDALSKGDQAGADASLAKIQALKVAGTAPKPASPWGKLSPEMAQIGVPPNPNDKESYPLGTKDPKFQADVQAYGGAVTNLKQKNAMALAGARGAANAVSRAQYQMIPVLDKQNDNTLTYASAMDIAKDKSRYEDASKGASLGAKEAMFQDMDGASKNLKDAFQEMVAKGEKFSPSQIAKMTAAMRDDPSGSLLGDVISNLSIAKAKDKLSPTQQRIAIAIKQNTENAFALRGVAGFGQGSEQLRGAIKSTLASFTSSPEYALKQIEAYDQQRERIHRGIPNVSVRKSTAQATHRFNPNTGTIEAIP
jgi:hypothetical protein